MGVTYKAILNKNKVRTKSGKHTVFLRVTLGGKSIYLNTLEKIEERYWADKPNKWIKNSHPFSFEINSLIGKQIRNLQDFEYKQKMMNNSLTLASIKAHHNKKSDSNVFNSYLDEFLKVNRSGKSLNTLKKYKTVMKYINDFNSSLTFNQLNETTFQQFAHWLEGKSIGGNTIHKYFDVFKVICRDAIKNGYLDKDPFLKADLGVKRSKPKRIYLDINEVSIIKNIHIPKERSDLMDVRTWWLFCFYCGFYYSDLKRLKWINIQSSEHGYCVVSERHKNENGYLVPVHKFDHAIQILEDQRSKGNEFVFPDLISEQKYNQKLKELAGIAKIEKPIMNKTARHSNIQFWEAQGLETQHVAKMVGHSKESTTKNYYDLSMRDINSRVAKFDFSSLDI